MNSQIPNHKAEWNYTAWNDDADRHATDTEIEWLGWERPLWSDEHMKQGEIPTCVDETLRMAMAAGGRAEIKLSLTATSHETITIELELD